MKATRIYSDGSGKSCFEELSIPLQDAGSIGFLSQLEPATGIIFRETPGTYNYSWHNAPRRQYILILEGAVDITVSSGETRRFADGDILLVEDTEGQGHCSKAVDGQPRRSIFVTLD